MQDELMQFSRDELIRAVSKLGITAEGTRLDQLIAALVLSGKTLDEVRAATKAPLSPSAMSHQVDAAIGNAVHAAELRTNSAIGQIASQVGGLASSITKVTDELAALGKSVKSVTKTDATEAAVAKAVAKAFAPLQKAMQADPAVQDRVVAVAPRERRPIADVFDLPGFAGDCEVWGPEGKFDPDYVWNRDHLKRALRALERGDNFWLWGERGTGKTQFAANLAARLGRPFFRVSFDANLERAEFIGADGLVKGATVWKDGTVLQAYRTPGAICLLDEVSTGRAEYMTTLHALLEPQSTFTVTSTGERVERAHGMVFIAADNTNGCGDATGRYAGTRTQNSALVDRFAYTERITFLPEQQEIDLLVKRGADAVIARKLVKVLTACRAEVGGMLVEPPSLRNAFAFAAYADTDTATSVWESTVVNKSPEESQESLRQIFSAHWEV